MSRSAEANHVHPHNDTILSTSLSAVLLVAGCAQASQQDAGADRQTLLERQFDKIPNDLPIRDSAGFAASFHPSGSIDLRNNFFAPRAPTGATVGPAMPPRTAGASRRRPSC